MKRNYIAVTHISNTAGVGILKVDPYGEYVIAELAGGGKPTPTKRYIEYDIEGEPYFEIYGMKFYSSEFLRTNYNY